jgi:hypothetical protein
MDALKMTAVEAPSPSRSSEKPLAHKSARIRLAPRIKLALGALWEAIEYCQDLERSTWDFALEIGSLRRLGLSNSDFRWLVGRNIVEHAIEVTLSGDAERSFRQPARLLFCKKTCFVLTPSGVALASEVCGKSEPRGRMEDRATSEPPLLAMVPPLSPLAPCWDRDRQELKVGSVVVKRFRVPAANQEAILAAFEEEHWPTRIDDPLPPHKEQSPKRRLQETIKSLNRNRRRPLIRFLGDGSGQGVLWEFCSEPDGSDDKA